jgi:hypothetical protein
MPNIQWKTPDDGQRNCPKHVEFLDKKTNLGISASVGFIKNKCCIMLSARQSPVRGSPS